jgi:two-component system response regulator HydG
MLEYLRNYSACFAGWNYLRDMARLLIVDDDDSFLTATAKYCAAQGHQTSTASCLEEARATLRGNTPDLLLLDLMLPDGNGLELLDELQDRQPARIAILTGHPGIKDLIRDVRGPALTYLTKPLDTAELLDLIAQAGDLEAAPGQYGTAGSPDLHFGLLVGDSPGMQAVYEQIEQVARLDATVFLQGESGTGKELVAQALHRESGRQGRFVPINCGGLSRELVASELFGHERGSFTGANRRHAGYFEQAHGGTLFLDEITEMPGEIQATLLRALENRRILRLGAEEEIPIDVRLLAATNREPAEAVKEGLLREDLFFRLQVFPVRLPPLRTRLGDIRLLADHFLGRLNREHSTTHRFSEPAYERMEQYQWPGNVRELKHAVHRAFVMTKAPDEEMDLADGFDNALDTAALRGLSPGRSIRDVERDLIMMTLEHFAGDKKATATTLGVSLKTLYNRLHDYEDTD